MELTWQLKDDVSFIPITFPSVTVLSENVLAPFFYEFIVPLKVLN
jgi:hypothetical protein